MPGDELRYDLPVKNLLLCFALLGGACTSKKDVAVDASAPPRDADLDASQSDARIASSDAMPGSPDAVPTSVQLTLNTSNGGSVSVAEGTSDLGSCQESSACTYSFAKDATVILAPVAGTLQHCTWTGACAGFPSGSTCVKVMDQDYQVGVTFDAIDADCL